MNVLFSIVYFSYSVFLFSVPMKEDASRSSCRGRGGRRRKACGRGGGVVTRRARLNNSTSATSDMTSGDVYEFRDDSEEEANRPRLILTIKSPDLAPTARPDVAPVAQPDPASTAPTQPNNSSSTRKSRRLQVSSRNIFNVISN